MLKFWKTFVRGNDDHELKHKYESFRRLLSENNVVLEIMADMEEKLSAKYLFDMAYLRSNFEEISKHMRAIVDNLNVLGDGKYKELYVSLDRIIAELQSVVEGRKEIPVSDYTLPFSKIGKDMTEIAGGKNANLCEVKNKVKLPVPEGFVISTYAYLKFMEGGGLFAKIMEGVPLLDNIKAPEARDLILNTDLPEDLAGEIVKAYDTLVRKTGAGTKVSVRSSAVFEDSESSFAGQYATALNVSGRSIIEQYKEIIASKFTPQVLFYLRSKGLSEKETAMAAGCVAMIDAKAAGVMYSQDPNDAEKDSVLISAAWGLGKNVVDGTITPDIYTVSKVGGRIRKKKVARKPLMLICRQEGIEEVTVPLELQEAPCLNDEQIRCLFDYAIKLEEHFGQPQDVEWALGPDERLYVLQTRPLRISKRREFKGHKIISSTHQVLLDSGIVACRGIGFGKVYKVSDNDSLENIPKGAVLVARYPSTRFVTVMDRASAIITDMGSTTGHMAAVAREFQVPTIVDSQMATETLSNGQEITVDAYYARVYSGMIPELLDMEKKNRKSDDLFKQTRIFRVAEAFLEKVIPLHLTDPWSKSFKPRFCTSFHDITRFSHEIALREMFEFNNEGAFKRGTAKRLICNIPLSIHVIDLGGGLDSNAKKTIETSEIRSIPMQALLRGMNHEGVRWGGYVPIDVKGFISVFANTVCDPAKGERALGEKTYAMLSENYVNFNSRLGYHFSTIDAYCGSVKNENYITFRFKGGAASVDKRERRAAFIARILKRLDFWVEQKGDFVTATFRKYSRERTEEVLDLLGRLIGCIRQLDVTMHSDERIDLYVEEFMNGNYLLGR